MDLFPEGGGGVPPALGSEPCSVQSTSNLGNEFLIQLVPYFVGKYRYSDVTCVPYRVYYHKT